jgi:hypothetical protein
MAFSSSRARRGRRLLVATAGVAAVSYSGCFLHSETVGNLMVPNCDATPNSDWCANYTDSGSLIPDAADATVKDASSDAASDAAGEAEAAVDGALADAASD